MKSEDDPEARIKELERSLTDQAQTSELGTGHASSGTAYLPPPVSGYTAPNYGSPPQYGTQPFGTQPYGTPYTAPRRKISGGIPWMAFGLIAFVLVAIAAGFSVFTTKMSDITTPHDSHVSGGGGSIGVPSIPSLPSIPSMPNLPGIPGDSGVLTASPDASASVSGIENNKTVACTDGAVTVSGIRNTVNITGHCVNVTVSGMNNVVTVDATDAIGASGFDNRITYHSGSPQIDSTDSNIVEQG